MAKSRPIRSPVSLGRSAFRRSASRRRLPPRRLPSRPASAKPGRSYWKRPSSGRARTRRSSRWPGRSRVRAPVPATRWRRCLAWFSDNKNFKSDNRILGSRYGVKTALRQRFGMCWDFSDCFVTLCRASGVPCRQVYGWVHPLDGHVWAEVLIEGKGWRQVDPEAGAGCDSRYVPFVASESGAMPMVYTSAVRIVPREAKDRNR